MIRGFVAGVVTSAAAYWFWPQLEIWWRRSGGWNFWGPEAQ